MIERLFHARWSQSAWFWSILSIICIVQLACPLPTKGESENIALEGTEFITYFRRANEPGSPSSVTVIFYRQKPTPELAEKILRSSLASAALINDLREILANAWYKKFARVDADEEAILLLDGSRSLIYSPADKKVLTFKEYSKAKTTVHPGEQMIEVAIAVRVENLNGKAAISGEANLPDGLGIRVSVVDPLKKNYEELLNVSNGKFRTKPFAGYASGTYSIRVFRSFLQLKIDSQDAVKQAGEGNKLLSGKYVETIKNGSFAGNRMLDYRANVEVP